MTLLSHRARAAAAVLLLVLSGSLLSVADAVATPRHPVVVPDPASGGVAISADEYGTNRYTHLQGPAIAEASPGELAQHSTTILNLPAGFRFNVASGSSSVDGIECDLRGKVTMTATQAKLTVTHVSTIPNCVIWFVGLQVQPTSGGVGGGNSFITKTGTSAAPGGQSNYGTLTKVPGAVDELSFSAQPGGSAKGGTPFPDQPEVEARDQFGNDVPGAAVKLSITPGTGTSGAHLTCANNLLSTDGNGYVDFAKCSINRVASYKLRATSGHITRDSGRFEVVVGQASGLVFKTYPSARTKATFNPQPRVAVVDAGGNTVTTYPTTHITLGINKNPGTFTCSGGYPVAQAFNGVAQFQGCKQTAVGSGYQLLAWVGFAGIEGKTFTVTH